MSNATYSRILNNLEGEISTHLDRIGLLYRIFGRAKLETSIQKKIKDNPDKYSPEPNGKKIQDIIGLRIALYFSDDLDITIQTLKNKYSYDELSSTIDGLSNETFGPTRCNLIFKIPSNCLFNSETNYLDKEELCDTTFEVQIRTVLSEGWHEIEHDQRYKYKSEWDAHTDLSRTLNGFLAGLETADWSILQLFEELSYRHYKNNSWEAMIRNKFRLRISGDETLNIEILKILNKDAKLGKSIFRANRSKILNFINCSELSIPLNLSNLIYIVNHVEIKDVDLINSMPAVVRNRLEDAEEKFKELKNNI